MNFFSFNILRSPLQKYFVLLKLSWSNGLVYRTSVLLWRLRNFLSSVMALTIWSVIYSNSETSFGYTQSSMITYIFLIGVLQSLILATIMHGLAEQIYSGSLSRELVKPMNVWGYLAVQEVADKLKNFGFVIVESLILYLIFQPSLHFMPLSLVPLFLLWLVCGTLIYFFINILFGTIGFWSPDVWAPKFLFYMFLDFTAGRLYPLDILPKIVQQIVYLTPFPYMSYAQLQLYLGRFDTQAIILNTIMIIGWTFALGSMAIGVWNRGMKDYSAAGQ